MTQVQLTDQQLNRALAELMGYTIYHYDKDVEENCYFMLMNSEFDPADPDDGRRKTEERAWTDAPDYCTDPAASLEVQEKAIELSSDKYLNNLDALVNPNPLQSEWGNQEIANLLTATPRERAEAAYITLQGAVGDESS